MNLRSFLYRVARALGDARAVEKGRVTERVERRIAGRAAARVLSALFRRR